MTAAREAEAFAPASVGNVALGFDVARRGVRIAAITGVGRDLPLEADRNTAGVALSALAEALDLDHGFEIAIVKGIPLGSGLGGSASAVAALVAANALVDRPVDDVALLTFAMQEEKAATGAVHVDNVAPSLFGGLVLTVGIHEPHVTRIPVPPGIRCVLVHPHIELSTRAAREVLRAAVPRAVDARVARDHGLSLYGVRLDGRRRLLLETPDHLELFDVAPDGRALAAHYPARQVILAGRAADAEERMLSVVDGSFLHQISGEGRNLVYQDPTGLRFRHGDDAAVRLAPLEGWSGWSALSPDARLIATVLKGPGAPLTLIPTGAGEPRPVTDLDSVVWSGWLEAGRLLVARSHLGQLDLRDYDLATGRSTAVAANLSSIPWEPSYDPQVGADAFQLWRTQWSPGHPVERRPEHPRRPTRRGVARAGALRRLYDGRLGSRRRAVRLQDRRRARPRHAAGDRDRRARPLAGNGAAGSLGALAIHPIRVTPEGAYAYTASQAASHLFLITGLR